MSIKTQQHCCIPNCLDAEQHRQLHVDSVPLGHQPADGDAGVARVLKDVHVEHRLRSQSAGRHGRIANGTELDPVDIVAQTFSLHAMKEPLEEEKEKEKERHSTRARIVQF
jgi:hypothetical protein